MDYCQDTLQALLEEAFKFHNYAALRVEETGCPEAKQAKGEWDQVICFIGSKRRY